MSDKKENRTGGGASGRNGDERPFAPSPLRPFALSILLFVAGCTSQVGPDSNPEVFKTAEQAMASRKQKLLLDWQEMTLRIANAERPDIKTIKADGFTIAMSADGIQRSIDLAPLQEKFSSATGREREPIRAFLAREFPPLDRARLKAIGFERAREMLHPYLANTKQTAELTAVDTRQPPIINAVVIDLNWVPVVRWPGSEAQTPVDADLSAAWNASADQVSAAAMANLRKAFAARAEPAFDTADLPGQGHYGTLRGSADPSFLLLGEFLAAVRSEWKTGDDMVVSFPSRTTINFLERKNQRLLNALAPEWAKLYAKVSEPMISTMLVDGDKGLSLFNYAAPASKPAAAAATQPKPTTKRVYIVH